MTNTELSGGDAVLRVAVLEQQVATMAQALNTARTSMLDSGYRSDSVVIRLCDQALSDTPAPADIDWKTKRLAAALYQACGAYDMPDRVLDLLSAAANGEPFVHLVDGVLPCCPAPAERVEQEDARLVASKWLSMPVVGSSHISYDDVTLMAKALTTLHPSPAPAVSRKAMIDVLLSTRGQSEGVTADAILSLSNPAPDGPTGDYVPDALFEEEFAEWWQQDGQYVRAGGGNYERTFAFEAWRHLYPRTVTPAAPDVAALVEVSSKILAKLQHPTHSVNILDTEALERALGPFEQEQSHD